MYGMHLIRSFMEWYEWKRYNEKKICFFYKEDEYEKILID